MKLITEAQLADLLTLPIERVAEMRRREAWPHIRLGRFDVRYTDRQIEQIIALHTIEATPSQVVARRLQRGQTARSVARHEKKEPPQPIRRGGSSV